MNIAFTKAHAWAIGVKRKNGFHPRRIVWGRTLARAEKRDGETILKVMLLSEKDIDDFDAFVKAERGRQMMDYMRKSSFRKRFIPDTGEIRKYDLKADGAKPINIPLITRLKQGGKAELVDPDTDLAGYNVALGVDWMR